MILHGNIQFDPTPITKKHINQSNWKRTAIITFDGSDLSDYYRWFIVKRYGLQLNKVLRESHITFINDRYNDDNKWNYIKHKYEGVSVEMSIDLDVRANESHWWFRVQPIALLSDIRLELGLTPNPYYPMHLTIGRVNNIQHNAYIITNILKHGDNYC